MLFNYPPLFVVLYPFGRSACKLCAAPFWLAIRFLGQEGVARGISVGVGGSKGACSAFPVQCSNTRAGAKRQQMVKRGAGGWEKWQQQR